MTDFYAGDWSSLCFAMDVICSFAESSNIYNVEMPICTAACFEGCALWGAVAGF